MWLKEAADDRSGVKFIDPINAFCDESKCRSYGDEGVLYTDTNHISDAGLERVYKNSKHAFDWLMNSDARSVGVSGSL